MFDGASFVMAANGDIVQQMPAWHETLALATLDDGVPQARPRLARRAARLPRLRSAGDGRARLRRQESLSRRAARAVGGRRFRIGARRRRRCARRRARARRDDAVALHARRSASTTRARWRRSSACATSEIPIEPMFESLPGGARRRIRGARARCDRGEHPGAHPRHVADGAVEQVRLDRAHHRQQVGDGRRLRDALRRHGRRLRRAEGHQQDARLPALPLPQRARSRDSRADHHARAVGRVAGRPGRSGFAAALRRARRHPRSVRRAGQESGRDRRDGLRAGARAPGRAPHQGERIQAPAGGGRHPDHAARLRPRLALPDHLRVGTNGRRSAPPEAPRLPRWCKLPATRIATSTVSADEEDRGRSSSRSSSTRCARRFPRSASPGSRSPRSRASAARGATPSSIAAPNTSSTSCRRSRSS